jgi:hypothetical protein
LKLRKLLEDVHLESEETAAILKRKHQEIVVDFQEQLDVLGKAKSRLGHRRFPFHHFLFGRRPDRCWLKSLRMPENWVLFGI